MDNFLITKYKDVEPYVPGEQPRDRQYLKLNTNESPYPPSEAVQKAVAESASSLQLYPDPACRDLKAALAESLGLSPQNILPTNGSDEVLSLSFMAYAHDEKPAYYPDVTYGFYDVLSGLFGVKAKRFALAKDFTINIDDYCGLESGLIVIANPNAPTGIAIGVDAVERICRESPDCVVLIDEAYVEFGAESCVGLVTKYPNLIVSRTYSKSMSLAGARLGYAIANEDRIRELETLKYTLNPYSVNRTALMAGVAAVKDIGYYRNNCDTVAKTRDETAERLKTLGFTLTDSKTNFVFCRHESVPAGELSDRLRKAGILVRHFTGERTNDWLRISVGTPEDMLRLTDTLEKILNGGIE
ncbi:MAG: histidinol-phosphate transaminase [Oscillospiraceae bacterium]|nr:histidinol-phosphate transaminase [Ruminococcus sp.]MCD8345200.1 histidinol-phosphate transaminase [Oscillospiraceae bacterium]